MPLRIFPTPQDAETAFYEALERADLELMMAVWSEDEEIVCVHPGGSRLSGQDQVRESWRQIFAGGAAARLHVTQQVTIRGTMAAGRPPADPVRGARAGAARRLAPRALGHARRRLHRPRLGRGWPGTAGCPVPRPRRR